MKRYLDLLDFAALQDDGPLATVGRVLGARIEREYPGHVPVWEVEVLVDRLKPWRSASASLFHLMPVFMMLKLVRGVSDQTHLLWLLVFYGQMVDRFWAMLCSHPPFQGRCDPARPPPLGRTMQPGEKDSFRWSCGVGAIW